MFKASLFATDRFLLQAPSSFIPRVAPCTIPFLDEVMWRTAQPVASTFVHQLLCLRPSCEWPEWGLYEKEIRNKISIHFMLPALPGAQMWFYLVHFFSILYCLLCLSPLCYWACPMLSESKWRGQWISSFISSRWSGLPPLFF
jgi:hypothetical protein